MEFRELLFLNGNLILPPAFLTFSNFFVFAIDSIAGIMYIKRG